MSEFNIPSNPTLAQIQQSLITCSNNLAKVGKQVSEYKADVALKETAYKRALARAKVMYQDKKPSAMINAYAETESSVIEAQDELVQANSLFIIASGELDGWDAQFVALRKIVEIKKIERDNG